MANMKPPVHYMSIIAIVALDITWGFFEGVTMRFSPMFILILSLILGFIGGAAVYYVQRHMAKDEHPQAMVKGIVMGILAGVPFMITGTVLGLAVLVWLAAMSVFKEQTVVTNAQPTHTEKRKREEMIIDDDPRPEIDMNKPADEVIYL
jgi:UPF0716 family protein affecting phage T7 exclusion